MRMDWVTKGVNADIDAAGYQVFGYQGVKNMSLAMVLHYHTNHSSTQTWPAVFERYRSIETLPTEGSNVQAILPMSKVTEERAKQSPDGKRNTYNTFTYQPTEELDKAFFAIFEEGLKKVKHVPGISAFMNLQPLSKRTVSKMSLHGGNSLGLEESDRPLVIYMLAWSWSFKQDDALIFATVMDIMKRSEQKAKEMRLWHPYKYINYAEEWQADDIYKGYGEDNLQTLKALQRKIDPEGVFTKGGLCGGYFRLNEKVENASTDEDET